MVIDAYALSLAGLLLITLSNDTAAIITALSALLDRPGQIQPGRVIFPPPPVVPSPRVQGAKS